MRIVDSGSRDSHVIRYDRLRRGNFFADFRRDKRLYPEIYHCIVQREGDAEILAWTQHVTLAAAHAAAEEHLERLSGSNSPSSSSPQAKARAAK